MAEVITQAQANAPTGALGNILSFVQGVEGIRASIIKDNASKKSIDSSDRSPVVSGNGASFFSNPMVKVGVVVVVAAIVLVLIFRK